MGLVLGEPMTNALKHAFTGRDEGRIDIAVRREDDGGRIALTVRDDGPGLPPGVSRPSRADSLGWRMIESMAARYEGGVEVDGSDGLRVRVAFVPET